MMWRCTSRRGRSTSIRRLLEAEAKVVVARIKDTIGLTTRVVVEPPGTIERSVGKARRVVDKRPRE